MANTIIILTIFGPFLLFSFFILYCFYRFKAHFLSTLDKSILLYEMDTKQKQNNIMETTAYSKLYEKGIKETKKCTNGDYFNALSQKSFSPCMLVF